MKCAYKKVLEEQRIDQIQDSYDEMSTNFLRLLDGAAGTAVHNQLGFGKIRLNRFYESTLLEMWESIEFYTSIQKDSDEYRAMFTAREADCKERRQNRDSIATSYVAMLLKLEEIGYDFEDYERRWAFEDLFYGKWHEPLKVKLHESRMDFVRRMEPTCRLYIAAGLVHLHEQYGRGETTLRGIHMAIRVQLNRFIERWVNFNDTEAFKLIDDLLEIVEKHGAEVSYWKGGDNDGRCEEM